MPDNRRDYNLLTVQVPVFVLVLLGLEVRSMDIKLLEENTELQRLQIYNRDKPIIENNAYIIHDNDKKSSKVLNQWTLSLSPIGLNLNYYSSILNK